MELSYCHGLKEKKTQVIKIFSPFNHVKKWCLSGPVQVYVYFKHVLKKLNKNNVTRQQRETSEMEWDEVQTYLIPPFSKTFLKFPLF